ncbi:MAG: hypothetical protein JWM44_4013 [Bacilli bacterium]|nr:hypothetical protein [Bacilli bacterium]
MSSVPKEIDSLLLIADISGYTKFMLSNRQSIKHSQTIITELTKTIIQQVKIPFLVSKLEGDAVFLYAHRDTNPTRGQEISENIGDRILLFFEVFSEKVRELAESNLCGCTACTNVTNLKLKVILHSGKILIYQIDQYEELSGVDVIILHRLLKNSVNSNEYLLITEDAFQYIQFSNPIHFHEGKEYYEEIGEVKTRVFYPYNEPHLAKKQYNTFLYKLKNEVKKIFTNKKGV